MYHLSIFHPHSQPPSDCAMELLLLSCHVFYCWGLIGTCSWVSTNGEIRIHSLFFLVVVVSTSLVVKVLLQCHPRGGGGVNWDLFMSEMNGTKKPVTKKKLDKKKQSFNPSCVPLEALNDCVWVVRRNLINWLCFAGEEGRERMGVHTSSRCGVKFEFLWYKISMNYYPTAHVLPANDTLSFPVSVSDNCLSAQEAGSGRERESKKTWLSESKLMPDVRFHMRDSHPLESILGSSCWRISLKYCGSKKKANCWGSGQEGSNSADFFQFDKSVIDWRPSSYITLPVFTRRNKWIFVIPLRYLTHTEGTRLLSSAAHRWEMNRNYMHDMMTMRIEQKRDNGPQMTINIKMSIVIYWYCSGGIRFGLRTNNRI